MKRPIITSLLLFIVLQIQAQTPLKISDQELERSKTELDSLKPLVVVQLKGERFLIDYMDSEQFIGALSPESISAIDVLKGNGAVSIYGQRAKNGVIMLTLLKSDGNDLLFKKLQAGKLPSPQIKTDVDISVNEKSSFTLDPSTLIKDGKVRIKGESQLGRNIIAPIIIVRFGKKEMELEKLSDLESLDAKHLKSIDVLKAKGDNNGRDTVTIQLVQSSKTKRFFRKLQRNQKE